MSGRRHLFAWVLVAHAAAGCLLGVEPRDHAGLVGDPCDERFQCTWDHTCSRELDACVPACFSDEDCPDGMFCDDDFDIDDGYSNDGCKVTP